MAAVLPAQDARKVVPELARYRLHGGSREVGARRQKSYDGMLSAPRCQLFSLSP